MNCNNFPNDEKKIKKIFKKREIPAKVSVLNVYKDVYEKNKKPRPLDYAMEIYRKEHGDYQTEDKDIKLKVQNDRVTIMRALTALTKGEDPVLGVIDDYFYIPKKEAELYNAHQYLYNNLYIESNGIYQLSKKFWILSLDIDKTMEAAKENVKSKKKNKNSKNDTDIDYYDDIDDDIEYDSIIDRLLESGDLTSQMAEFILYVDGLSKEIEELKSKINEQNLIEKQIETLSENLKIFIGREYFNAIYPYQNHLLIALKFSKEDIANNVHKDLHQKLSTLLKEIDDSRPKPRRNILTGKLHK